MKGKKMDLMDNATILLKKVLVETEDGFRLRTTTRMEIKNHIEAVERDKEFMTEIMSRKDKNK